MAAKDPAANTLYVTNDLEVVQRPRREFRVHRVNWVAGPAPPALALAQHGGPGMRVGLKLRHGPGIVRGTVSVDAGDEGEGEGGGDADVLRVVLDERDKGIAPGQFAAFYVGTECLGAGVVMDTAKDDGAVWAEAEKKAVAA